MAGHLGLGRGRPDRLPGAGLPDLRGRRGARRGARRRDGLADLAGPGDAGAALAELPVEPDRPGAPREAPEEGRRLVPRARHDPGLRRVLHRVRLGGRRRRKRAGLRAAPVDVRRLDRGDPDGPLPVEAVQPRGLPVRVPRRRPRAGRRAARRTQEPRAADARAPAGGDDRGAGRRRPRPRAARAVRRPAGEAARGPGVRGVPDRPLRGVALPLGDAAESDEDCWDTVSWLAERGILAAPGTFYGRAGSRHVRIAFTATDERIDAAVERLAR